MNTMRNTSAFENIPELTEEYAYPTISHQTTDSIVLDEGRD